MATANRRSAALAFIFVTVVLDMMALGVTIPVFPRLIAGFVEDSPERTARLVGLFGTVWAAMHFLFSPIAGGLSDRFGRRPIILLSNLGLGLDYVLMALAPDLSWLFVGRAISGITAASIATAHAYVADVTPGEKLAQTFAILGAAFGLGFVLGPALGGLLGAWGPRLPFWVAAGLSLLNAAYGAAILPESLLPERRSRFSWRNANPLGALLLLKAQPRLIRLAGVSLAQSLAYGALPSVFVIYAGYRYGWSPAQVGITLAAVGIVSMIVQAALVQPFVRRFGEAGTLLIGLAFGVAGFGVYGLAPTGTMFLIGIPVMAGWGLAGGPLQSLMTRQVGPSEQGRLQGFNASLVGLADLASPGMFAMTFAAFIGTSSGINLPGAPFLLAGLVLVIAFVLTLGWMRGNLGETAPTTRSPR